MIRDMLESMDCIVDEVYINVDKLTEGLAVFGYVQQETRPKSKKNLEYRRLGFKAIRIMNRLAQTIYKHGIERQMQKVEAKKMIEDSVNSIFIAIVKQAVIKMGNDQSEKLALIPTNEFFRTL
jgi:hypothetical protein